MVRPVWSGYLSFGLVSIPVSLISAEKKVDLHFHLIDSRDKSRIRYERVNSETGKEVPWNQIVKAYEFDKGSYVEVNEEAFQKANQETFKSVEIEEFVDLKEIDSLFFEKPYYLIPEGKNKKAYVLLREALKKTNKVGVAKVVIRTKEYLGLIMAHHDALVLNIIRFDQEIRDEEEFEFPTKDLKDYRIKPSEVKMATELIKDMSAKWQPKKYHDQYRETLMKWIETQKPMKVKSGDEKTKARKADEVIDFMALLKKSMHKKSGKKTVRKKS